jgi:hypothetical protein
MKKTVIFLILLLLSGSVTAFKSGFEPDYKKVNLTVESLPSIKVSVQDSQENSIEIVPYKEENK